MPKKFATRKTAKVHKATVIFKRSQRAYENRNVYQEASRSGRGRRFVRHKNTKAYVPRSQYDRRTIIFKNK